MLIRSTMRITPTCQRIFILVVTLACVALLIFYKNEDQIDPVRNFVQQTGYMDKNPHATLLEWLQKMANVSSPALTHEKSNESTISKNTKNETSKLEQFNKSQVIIASNAAPGTASPKKQAACKLPQLKVDDPLIKPYVKELGPLQCAREKNWVYTTGDGKFYIDPDTIRRHGPVSCVHFRVGRLNDTNHIEVPLGRIRNGSDLNGDIFRIQCYGGKDNSVYDNIHATVPHPKKELLDRIQSASDRLSKRLLDLNIFVYVMDSVSRMSFIRKLPKFYELLTKKMGAYIMEGYNIVGDGTPLALIPMTTGHFPWELPEGRKRFSNAIFLDNWPMIYYNFSNAGYITSYVEEQPFGSAYSLRLKGFDKSPVDHYLRTFLIAVENLHPEWYIRPRPKPWFCLGDTPRSILWINFFKELQNMYRPLGGRHFELFFSSEMSHEDFWRIPNVDYNSVQQLDEHWTRAFGELYDNNFLNDTLLFIMADHGHRFGKVRQTQSGKLEEKLPFLAIVPPPWFRERFPKSSKNLEINRHRLVTVFDLHATYLHLLDFREDGGKGNLNERGLSLLREIPSERQCSHAHIKAHFCSCLDWVELKNLEDPTVLAGTQKMIDKFNNQTMEMKGRCAKLEMGRILSARLLQPSRQMMAYKESSDFDHYLPKLDANGNVTAVLYQIRFITEPGGGDWEASLTYFLETNEFQFSPEDVSRLNAYHQDAGCVLQTHPHLRTFCYCLGIRN